ncbi:MAG TPA: 3-hydroxyacyl-ACP dehydratase FabZ [Candidatus Binatia bacterium]|nr:3-hydroxyacyl-ACP dehydratase FabZ [Candidatus Binatia bacterium]
MRTLDIRQLMRLLPHRAPFLLLDRVTECGDQHVIAIKNVTFNEPFFPGHFPEVPTMPGVLILEALAQACGVMAMIKSGKETPEGQILYFAGVDEARFRRPVGPGDRLVLKGQLRQQKRDVWKFSAEALVDDERVCEALLTCVLRDAPKTP